jgi:hypothetical protein
MQSAAERTQEAATAAGTLWHRRSAIVALQQMIELNGRNGSTSTDSAYPAHVGFAPNSVRTGKVATCYYRPKCSNEGLLDYLVGKLLHG